MAEGTTTEIMCGLGQSKCSSLDFLQGVMIRFGGCDPAQQLLRLLTPWSVRGSEENVARPTPHFAACAHYRSLEVCLPSVPKLAGRHTCNTNVWPWTSEMLFAGNAFSSAERMRSIPAASSLAFPPCGPGLGEKCGAPHAALCSLCPLPQP
jgi:hypothetical protein